MKTVADMQTILKKLSKYWQQNATVHTFDGNYETLDILSKDNTIQNICYEVTKRHALDERSHSGVFSHVALEVLKNESKETRTLFINTLKSTVPLFAHTEMKEWEKIFGILNFPNYQEILRDTDTLKNIGIYDNSVNKLLLRLGAM